MVDRSCGGRAAEAASTAVVHECTMREDAIEWHQKVNFAAKETMFSARNLNAERLGILRGGR